MSFLSIAQVAHSDGLSELFYVRHADPTNEVVFADIHKFSSFKFDKHEFIKQLHFGFKTSFLITNVKQNFCNKSAEKIVYLRGINRNGNIM
jgi:hypothetical protein